ncbi:DUF1735 domain-containing protein [uncultured Algoriphagus sp.]|uniref:DUF1735 domain-containing protein n=1 Tax=uncultured Algoriphagus sp. TaxID=417365 RepID=UPI0030EEBDA8|tara:strand:+ start:10238 stop:11188 length:951 start_codon:yes stop_codon:yes gene_type:complete
MKNIFNKLGVFALAILTLTSCLDEDPIFDPDQVENVIEFYDIGLIASANSVYPLYVNSFKEAESVEFKIIVSYSGAHENNQDINVKFSLDPSALEEYNESEDTDYVVLPENLYSIDAMEVTIPKGQRQVEKTITLYTSQFDFTKNYALPFTITESSHGIISGNFETAIYAIGAKNKYDGIYSVTGEFTDLTNGNFTGYYPYEVELRTITGNSVGRWDRNLDVQGYRFLNSGSGTYFGSFGANFIMDDEGNVTSVVNAYGQPSSNNRSAQIDPSGVNTFTIVSETDKTLEVSYYLIQPTGSIRCTFKETFTFLRDRE